MPKTLDQNFIDWEAYAFGFGYGTGEPYVMFALKTFLGAFEDRTYDFQKLETAVTPTVAWLLINTLCGRWLDIIEYGTSPRHGWLTPNGEALKSYVDSKSADALADLVCSTTEDYVICSPDACNCGPRGYEEGRVCVNPFWPIKRNA
jgi:hypothetical protein